jgi:hypothetical protein
VAGCVSRLDPTLRREFGCANARFCSLLEGNPVRGAHVPPHEFSLLFLVGVRWRLCSSGGTSRRSTRENVVGRKNLTKFADVRQVICMGV